jgi:hypothetical protein
MVHRVSVVYGLSIPNVSVTLASPDIVVLDGEAKEGCLGSLHPTDHSGFAEWYRSLEPKLRERDWRGLRDQFVLSLRLEDRDAVAEWLNHAGYVPTSALSDADVDESRPNRAWIAEDVTPVIVEWLRKNREAVEWLLKLEHPAFVEAIDAAWTWLEQRKEEWGHAIDSNPRRNQKPKPREPKEPSAALAQKLRLPRRIDPDTLQRHLMGGGRAPSLHAIFRWTRDGRPIVSVLADTPMTAISLSTHIDRNFSKLRQASCDYCHISFPQKSPRQRFHSAACHDKWHNARKAQKRELQISTKKGRK